MGKHDRRQNSRSSSGERGRARRENRQRSRDHNHNTSSRKRQKFRSASRSNSQNNSRKHNTQRSQRTRTKFSSLDQQPSQAPHHQTSQPQADEDPQSKFGPKQSIKNLSLMKKLNPSSLNMGLGMTLVESNSNYSMGLNSGMFNMITEASKIKRKIKLPKDSNFNYSGLLIGPKGNSQKQLQEKTGCRILVRGKGSQSQPVDYQDEEQLHVLVLGDNQGQVAKACAQIERIIFADEQTLNKMKQQQMVQYQQGITGGEGEADFNLSLTTPYGPPSQDAYVVQVPNECVGLVIGKEGQTIKAVAKRSGADKVQVATASAPGSKYRNIFVEGDPDAVQRVRKELNTIVETQRKMTSGAVTGSHRVEIDVPARLIGLVIGKGGQTIKGINTKTGAFVSLNKDEQPDRDKKYLTIQGTQALCIIAQFEIDQIVQKGLINLQNTTGGLSRYEADKIHPIVPISQQLANLNIPIPVDHPTIKEDPTLPYNLKQSLQKRIDPSQLYKEFLGGGNTNIQETILNDNENVPKKKRWTGRKVL